MKFRPDSTTSERQLLLAMADAGRPLSLAELASWRRDGLLPPLASQGLGPGKGKSYYWREPDIVAHASAAFDFLKAYGRPDAAICMLWLSGFCVPLTQFRRAWAYRGKSRKATPLRPAAAHFESRGLENFATMSAAAGHAPPLLLEAAFILSGAIAPDDAGESAAIVELLHRALRNVTRANHAEAIGDRGMAEQLWLVIKILGSTLETSNLVLEASDSELREAQHYLGLAARLIQASADEGHVAAAKEGLWSPWLAEHLGPSLFMLVLVLLRSGRRGDLERAARNIEGPGRQNPVLPAQPAPLHA